MHVFIDTNIFLNFYHFTADDLDALHKIFVSHDKGAITVHLTNQVRDEFWRKREGTIQDALKRFKTTNLSAQFPYFMKVYDEYSVLQDLSKKFKTKHFNISKKAGADIKAKNLRADHLIGEIFEKATFIETDKQTYEEAKMRMDVGNPPGKKGSIGDAINWLLLIAKVPNGEDLYIISEDSDYYSLIDGNEINPFLFSEWHKIKNSIVKGYRNLTEFLKAHYDGVQLSFDPHKKELIDALETTPSFAVTHSIIANLGEYKYFSLEEAKTILDAVDANSQLRWIIRDEDILEFLKMAVLPHKNNLTKESHQDTIEEIMAAIKENDEQHPEQI